MEILQNWSKNTQEFTRSAFRSHILSCLTVFQSMWDTDGFFPATAEYLGVTQNAALRCKQVGYRSPHKETQGEGERGHSRGWGKNILNLPHMHQHCTNARCNSAALDASLLIYGSVPRMKLGAA